MNDSGGTENTERLHALDAVRGFALLAGIVFHATVSFLPSPKGVALWIVMDNERSLPLALVFHVLHIFRMTTFFFIAGYFAHLTLNRRGTRAFVRDRLKRICLPLLVGWPISFGLIAAVTIWGALIMQHAGQKLPPPLAYHFPAFPWTHLWFLYVLLLLYSAMLALRGLVAVIDRAGRLRGVLDRLILNLAATGPLAGILAIPTGLELYLIPNWLMWFGIPTPDWSLVPNLAATTAFSVAFGCGFLAQRQRSLLEVWRRQWPFHLAAALLFTALELGLVGLPPAIIPETSAPVRAEFAVCYALASWCWTFALVGLALRFLSHVSASRRYIADASYWFYLAHLPIVMALQVAVSRLDVPWYVKFAFILAATFAILFGSYALLVRNSFIGAVLNGKRLGRTPASSGQAVAEPA